jgi:[NiFe] hydrogenase diaphorase moiety large subunit
MAGARNVQAVQVGGPSGICIGPNHFDRKIAFEDLATGGSIIIFGQSRNLLVDAVLNFMDFFIEESCSSCAPCRSLTVILRNSLQRIIDGNGTSKDLHDLLAQAKMMKMANRCGLGQTAANPIISTIENFRPLYEKLIKSDKEFISTFDMKKAVKESCAHVGRKAIIHE